MGVLTAFERWRFERQIRAHKKTLEGEALAAVAALLELGIPRSQRRFRVIMDPYGFYHIVDHATRVTVQVHADGERADRICAHMNYAWHVEHARPAVWWF